jgi:hypothetical protein
MVNGGKWWLSNIQTILPFEMWLMYDDIHSNGA